MLENVLFPQRTDLKMRGVFIGIPEGQVANLRPVGCDSYGCNGDVRMSLLTFL